MIVVTHNSEAHIRACLESLLDDPAGPKQVVVVDNGSIDTTHAIVKEFAVDSVFLDDNEGFPYGCNRGAAEAFYDTYVFLNPDAVALPGWLPPLMEQLNKPGVGTAMPVMELTYKPGHYFTSHSALTFLGFAWSTDWGEPVPADLPIDEVPFPSGAAFAIRKELFELLDGFRAHYFLYLEDVDLGWRVRLRGLRNMQVPSSRVRHDYDFNRHARKMFYLERNRFHMVLANFEPRTRRMLVPALMAAELGVVVAAFRHGWFDDKREAWKHLWKTRKQISQDATATRRIRVVGDAAILSQMDSAVTGINQMPVSPLVKLINPLMGVYLRLVTSLVNRLDRNR